MPEEGQVQEPQAQEAQVQPAQETPEPQASEPQGKLTQDEMKAKIREGKLSYDEEKAFLQDPEKFISENVLSKEEEKPKEKEQPSIAGSMTGAPEPKAEPDPDNMPISTADEFVKALQARGFTYKDARAALEGYVHKEQAVGTFKEEAKKLKQQYEALQAEKAELEKKLKESQVQPAPAPVPQVAPAPVAAEDDGEIELPERPSLADVDTSDPDSLKEYEGKMKDYNDKLSKKEKREFNKRVAEMQKAFEERATTLQTKFDELLTTRERETQERQREEESRQRRLAFDNAIMAVQRLQRENPEYKTTEPIQDVHEKYLALASDIDFIKSQNPYLQTRDLLTEYLSGNPDTKAVFDRYAVNVHPDIKTYQLMVALERDAKEHNDFDDGGVPDLSMALLRHKKRSGVLQQEMVNKKLEGYNEHDKIAQSISSASGNTIPASEPANSESGFNALPQEQLIAEMRRIKELPPNAQKAEYAKLAPHFKAHGLEPLS